MQANNIGTTSINELPVTNSVGIINQNTQMSTAPPQMQNINTQSSNISSSNSEIPKIVNDNIKNSVVMDSNNTQNSYNELVGQIQQADKLGVTQLPSRDIPNNSENIVMDNQTKPNYIPEQEILEDYIKNYETPNDVIEAVEKDDNNKNKIEELYNKMQMPLLVAILYFLFNLPIIRIYLIKYVPNIFNKDGNPNIMGYVVNSILFGLLYYILNNLVNNLLN